MIEAIIEKLFNKTYGEILWRGFAQGIDEGFRIIAEDDRDSTKNFDVHGSLKGIDKSASASSVGITANLQGKRADFILADDKSYVVYKLFKFGETLCISIQYRQYRAKTYL